MQELKLREEQELRWHQERQRYEAS